MRGTRFLLLLSVPFRGRRRMQRKRLFGEHHFTQSSTYPQTVKWHVLFYKKTVVPPPQKKRKCVWGTTTANIHCLFATFPKSNVLQCTPKRDFCVGDFDLCMKRKKKRKERKYSIFSILFLFWAWQKEWTKNGPRPKKSKKSVIFKTVCAAPSGPPLVSSTGDAGWTESTFFGSRCWLMSDPKKDVAC